MIDVSIENRRVEIGKLIAKERKIQHLSQAKLGVLISQELGLSEPVQQNVISNWERGRNLPSLDSFFALSKVFACDVAYLLLDRTEKTSGEQFIVSQTGLSPETVRYLCNRKKWGIGKDITSIIDLLIWDEGHTFKGEHTRSILSFLSFFFRLDGDTYKQLSINGKISDSVTAKPVGENETEIHIKSDVMGGYTDSAFNINRDILENAVLLEMQTALKKLKRHIKFKK